jgi:hypothetical protein
MTCYPTPPNPDRSPNTAGLDALRRACGDEDTITAEQLRAAGRSEEELRPLPTPHGPASAPYCPATDLIAWPGTGGDQQ